MKKYIIFALILLCICGAAAVYAIRGIVSEKNHIDTAEKVSAVFSNLSPSKEVEALSKDTDKEDILLSFKARLEQMQAVNPDVCGWIYIPETHIDYPLLQGRDNSYYLTHGADKSPSPAGAVFLDSGGFSENTLIYGHNMGRSSNVIFHDITNLSDKAWFEKVKQGYIITKDDVITLDFFAYALTKAETPFYSNKPDFEYIKNNAVYYREATGNKTVTLSTCAYDYDGARAVLVGVWR
ncbi:MAG: class B sortase [Firmicutes bacterium]|nr:class B sortase [Bacillota bacterium]